ncbi:MAG: uracil-DNA glycosylase family protein [Spirochaetia bacterium]|nr:uracil-DNA glycosylase family protein [Spirochaetia bacterium]
MHVEYYPDLLDIIKSLQYALKNSNPDKILFNRWNEPGPLDIDLSFSPVISEKTVEEFIKQDVCTFCDRRISYKANQFSKPVVKLPYLILVHNTFIMSDKQYYESASVDSLFRKMIKGGLKCNENEMLIREILRCHFGGADEKNNQYVQNCLQHLRKDIDRYQIKGVLILGQAASLLFKNDTAKINKITGEIFDFEGIPAMICPGPNRLDYMYQKHMDEEKINTERRTIFNYLTKFRTEVMYK